MRGKSVCRDWFPERDDSDHAKPCGRVQVQIWCAWAELLLGEASFSKPILASRGR